MTREDRLLNEIIHLHENCDTLRRENQSLRKDCDTLRLRLDVAKAEARRLWSENDALRKERGERALAAKCEQDRLLLENEALRKELAVTRGELARVSVAHDRVADELRDLRQKLPTERVPTKQPPPGGRGDVEVGLDTLRGWLARDRDLLAHATWCIASLVTNGDSAPAKDLLAARELMDEIRRTLTRRAGGER